MADRVFVHVGAMKSGTTYLQALCQKNDELLRSGYSLWYPGTTRVFRATQDITHMVSREQSTIDQWPALLEDIRQFDGDVLISNELLLGQSRSRVRKIVGGLQPAEVYIIVTARDLARVMRSQWQTRLRVGRTVAWADYYDALSASSGDGRDHQFWRRQYLPDHLPTWLEAVPGHHLTLVTVPPEGSDPAELGQRFMSALQRDVEGLIQPPPTNHSLGLHSAELLRQLNESVRDWEWPRYRRAIKKTLSSGILEKRSAVEPRLTLDADQLDIARALSIDMVKHLKSMDLDVIGSLDELIPAQRAASSAASADPTPSELLDTAMFALAELGSEFADLKLKYERLEARVSPDGQHHPRARSRLVFWVERRLRTIRRRAIQTKASVRNRFRHA